MIKYLYLTFVAVIPLCPGIQPVTAQTALKISVSDSKIIWIGSKLTGTHQGEVKFKEGQIIMTNNRLTGGYFVADMTTINCRDIPSSDPVPKRNLENHLKHADFFDVARFPVARFEITEVQPHPGNPEKYIVLGYLTIKGITRPLKTEVTPSTQTSGMFTGKAELKFNRQLFGVAYRGLKDELVHDEVKLNIIIKAKSR